MGADFIAVCHSRKEWMDLNRPMRSGGLTDGMISVLIYDWTGLPVVFLSDQHEGQQDLYYAVKTGNAQLFGHLVTCDLPRACTCHEYREVKPEKPERPRVSNQVAITLHVVGQVGLTYCDDSLDVLQSIRKIGEESGKQAEYQAELKKLARAILEALP